MVFQEFERDDAKRRSTVEKHGIDFEDAKLIFDGRPVLHTPSNQKGEDRWIAVSNLNGLTISVIYTFRGEKIRIGTARRANKMEREHFNDKFNGGNDPPKKRKQDGLGSAPSRGSSGA